MFFTSKEIYTKRIEICKQCEHLKIAICSQCGCVMPMKARVSANFCPLDKWKAVEETFEDAPDEIKL